MTKPFDVQDLIARLKTALPHLTEEMLKEIANQGLDWAAESCMLHPNALVKILGTGIPMVKPAVLNALDKIDGQVG